MFMPSLPQHLHLTAVAAIKSDIPALQERLFLLLCGLSIVLSWPSSSFNTLGSGMCHSQAHG